MAKDSIRLPILDVDFGSNKQLEIDCLRKDIEMTLDNVKIVHLGGADYYNGDYIVDPDFEEQTLHTKKKIMKEDVTVKPIAVSRTANLSGGITVYIGGILDG